MKKALVILLALTMVMSMVAMIPMGASAAEEEELAVGAVAEGYKPEGTAINNAEEFAAMAADGKYYLAADIELNATYLENFTGTLDGNGKAITTSVPVFDQLNGTIKNLTVKGYIETKAADNESSYVGAIAIKAGTEADTVFENVANYATMTHSIVIGQGGFVGIVGAGTSETTTTFTNCANYGFINGNGSKTLSNKGNAVLGQSGFVGVGYGASDKTGIIFTDCVNAGDIDVTAGRVGGLIGVAHCSINFIDCVNTGTLSSQNAMVGGFAGRVGADAAAQVDKYLFEGCENKGDIFGAYHDNNAGIGGFIGNAANVDELVIKDCINRGNVDVHDTYTAGTNNLGGFVGCLAGTIKNGPKEAGHGASNNKVVLLENCTNYGNVGDERLFTFGVSRNGGIVGQLCASDSAKFINCYNYGNVYAKNIMGGIVGAYQSGRVIKEDAQFIGCGNYGLVKCANIASYTTYVGGILGYLTGTTTKGPEFLYCINLGEVAGNHVRVGGIVGFDVDGQENWFSTIKYCIIGGKVYSQCNRTVVLPATGVVGANNPYSYTGANGKTRYFFAPANGKVTIDGDNVKFVASAVFPNIAGDVPADKVIAKNKTYFFTVDNVKYALHSQAAGTVVIDTTGETPKATLTDGTYVDVIKWALEDDNMTINSLVTFDKDPVGNALSWGGNWRGPDTDTNIVLMDEVGNANRYGFGGWCAMHAVSETGVTMADLKSGKIAYELNREIGEEIFRQNLRADLFEVDEFPTTDKTHAKVTIVDGDYWNVTFDPNDDLGSPETGDATIYVVIALAVSAIALAGFMVAKKVKEN